MNVNLNNTDNNDYVRGYKDGKKAGATEWAGKAQPVIDALEQIQNSPTPFNATEMESWIETARNLAATALAKYKEVTGE